MSYAAWTQQMHTPTDPMLLISPMKSNPERMGFKNFIFNFDSAAGLRYEVDVTKPEGEKVRIFEMEDGRPFRMEDTYTVAMTAYRANGGGELLTKGAGLSKEEIDTRIIHISEHDIRYYLLEYVKELGTINPQPKHHWRFVPEEWATQAAERERKILFGSSPNPNATSQTPSEV